MTVAQIRKMVADFDWEKWEKELQPEFASVYKDLVHEKASDTTEAYGADGVTFDAEDPFVSKHLTKYIGDRITQLSDTTKNDVSDALVRALDKAEGLSTSDFRDLVLDTVRDKYDGYESWRALRIGRSESAIGYNTGTVLGGLQADFEEFDVTDGTDDEECAAADGSVWDADECLEDPIGHPNCTRVFTPHTKDASEEGNASDDEDDVAAGAGLQRFDLNYVTLSPPWVDYLRNVAEAGMGYQLVDVRFTDGRGLSNAAVLNGELLVVPKGYERAEVAHLTLAANEDEED